MNNSVDNTKQISPKVSKISIFIASILMGNVGLLVSFLSNFPVYTIALLRGIFGFLFLSLFMLKTDSFSPKFLKSCFKNHWKPLIAIGMIYSIEMFLFFWNILLSGYAIATFLLYTNGIFLLLFLAITREEKVSLLNLISFILVIIGVALIMEFWTGLIHVLGIVLGLLSGISLALYIFFRKKIYNKREIENLNINAEGNFDIFLALWDQLSLIIFFLPFGVFDLIKLTLVDLTFALILGLFPTAIANILYNIGVQNDKGGNILIIMYLEPVVATINTVIFLRNLSIFTIIGGSLILLANLIILRYSK